MKHDKVFAEPHTKRTGWRSQAMRHILTAIIALTITTTTAALGHEPSVEFIKLEVGGHVKGPRPREGGVRCSRWGTDPSRLSTIPLSQERAVPRIPGRAANHPNHVQVESGVRDPRMGTNGSIPLFVGERVTIKINPRHYGPAMQLVLVQDEKELSKLNVRMKDVGVKGAPTSQIEFEWEVGRINASMTLPLGVEYRLALYVGGQKRGTFARFTMVSHGKDD